MNAINSYSGSYVVSTVNEDGTPQVGFYVYSMMEDADLPSREAEHVRVRHRHVLRGAVREIAGIILSYSHVLFH